MLIPESVQWAHSPTAMYEALLKIKTLHVKRTYFGPLEGCMVCRETAFTGPPLPIPWPCPTAQALMDLMGDEY